MIQLAIYGKGGSGKSTVAAALSVLLSRRGLSVFQVGCDPKADSTLVLTGGTRIPTLLGLLAQGKASPAPEDFIFPGLEGIDCAEAGGPVPGAGCGGRGIARMFELFAQTGLLEKSAWDVVLYDVLGDVVCGGFAAPLRQGFAGRAIIVVSEEPQSLYAANNIIQAVESYRRNGVSLAGLVVNVADSPEFVERVNGFAREVGTSIIGMIQRDPAIHEAELSCLTAAHVATGEMLSSLETLADNVLASFDVEAPACRPLEPEEFERFRWKLSGRVRTVSQGGAVLESDGEVRDVPSVVQAGAAEKRQGVTGTLLGGQAARQFLSDYLLLGTGARVRHGIEVEQFALDNDAIVFKLVPRGMPGLVVVLAPDVEGEACYARASGYAVSHKGELTPAARSLLDHVVKRLRLAPVSWHRLSRMVLSDPEMTSTSESLSGATTGPTSHGLRMWREWGAACAPGRFFFDEERSRMVAGHIRLGGARTFNIHHSTDVCQFSEQRMTRYSSHLVRFPWSLERREHTTDERSDWVSTRLQEHHLIAGSDDRLSGALDSVLTLDEKFDAVSVYVSCTPAVAGEDWHKTIRDFQSHFDGPVLVAGIGETDVVDEIIRAVRQVRPAPHSTVGKSGSGVHLVGFPPGRGVRELQGLLEEAGVNVASVQVPVVDYGGLAGWGDASGALLWPQQEYQRLYDDLFSPLGLPCHTVESPYGLAGTTKLVQTAAGLCGVDADAATARVRPALERARRQLEPLREQAGRYRLGLALAGEQGDLLDHPERTCGVPLIPFLDELGFRIEVLLDCDAGSRTRWWLTSGLSAVYSDLSLDERLLSAGVGRFSLADLEPGFEGAVRTAGRLLRLCRAGFWRDFACATGRSGGKQ